MIKISALNEESSEESDEENNVPTITKEAQEQIALTEYNKALELLKEEKIEDALSILKDLLETELLDQVEKPEVPDGRTRPMLSLKYCCYKNIGGIYAQLENYDEAIDNYWAAANLDDTDVMLWCRMGTLAMKTGNLEFACSAFKQGLKCNPNHWPCLDNIITCMLAVPDYMNCLLYISMALERDPSFVKGLAFREKIFKDIPFFEESYKLFNPDWALDPPLDTEYDRCLGEKLLNEAKEIADRWIEACRPDFEFKPIADLSLNKPVKNHTWLDLGESLIDMHKHITDNNLNFISKIHLNIEKQREGEPTVNGEQIEEEKIDEADSAKAEPEEMLADSVSEQNSVDIECEIDFNIKEEKVFDKLDDQEVPDIKLVSEMEVDVEDEEKSSHSDDVQIIDDDGDPLKIEPHEIKIEEEDKIEENGEFPETINISDDLDETLKPEKSPEPVNEPKPSEEIVENGEKEVSSEKTDDKNSRIAKSSEQAARKLEQQKVKKRRRSSLCFLQQWAWSSSSMRRSPRVRGSNRREPERDDVELEETMRRIFPNNLLPDTAKIIREDPLKSMDDSMDTMDLYQLFANRENNGENKSSESSKSPSPENSVDNQKYFGSDSETIDVQDFINQHSGKSNLMIIIAKFTELLCLKWNHEWPRQLIDLYLQSYLFTREHIPHSSPFGEPEEEESILKHDSAMTLLFCELHTDKWLDNKPDSMPTCSIDKFGTGIPSEELGYVIFASARDSITNDDLTFLLRVLWVKANIFMCQADTEVAIKTLELLIYHLEQLESTTFSVKLPNCKYYSPITLPIVQKRLTSIERGKKLGEVQRLYDEHRYAELSAILQETFKYGKQRNEVITVLKLNVDRVKQLSMLLDCLWQLEQYEECFIWGEACLNEAWQVYMNSGEEADRKKWAQSILNCLDKLEACVDIAGTAVIKYLDSKASRLVQNLIQITCHQLDVPDNIMEMPLETVVPWILLHHILQYEEDKERAKSRQSPKSKAPDAHDSESEDEDKDIPAPLMILFTGHEFLGRHAWCCINEAKLLLFIMKTVIPTINGPRLSAIREKIGKHLEQIFWCMYGHPMRTNKAKPKHLEDHVPPTMPLTWDVAQLLFEFYKPEIIPEFDSARPMSITSDTKDLFKKISTLVPKDHDPSSLVEDMTAHITEELKERPAVSKPLPYQVDSLYYLLGDYSFKNNNWPSAIKYYTMDIVLHPGAFNSWAALAMSIGTVMGTSLNNCKPVSDLNKFLSNSKIAQCCYQKAVELRPGHSVIWIEYGNFVYMVHSFCSRLLKQESDTFSMEMFEIWEGRKEETLKAAENCFLSANRIYLANIDDEPHMQDERWLYYYMLAKIAEKKNEEPPVFLEHYGRASELLYKNNARYPKRISHKQAHHLAVEALEVHYRIHASILKYLEQHEGKSLKKSLGQLFLKHLLDCANGPFMQYPSKLNKNKRKDDVSDPKNITKEYEATSESIPKNRTEKRQNSVEEIPISEKSDTKLKNDSRKRTKESPSEEPSKRMKMGNISHLQLMQDVLSVIDDLITKVCDMSVQREQKDVSSDEVMIISSDESDRERQPGPGERKEAAKTLPSIAQDAIDHLMKQSMDIDVPHTSEEEESRKNDGKWLQNDDLQASENVYLKEKDYKEKPGEKKKTQVNAVKEEATMSRRGSQESTTTTLTTTTNETNNSSYSSSDESSSSDDSSDSDSSSVDSDSDSGDSEAEKIKKTTAVEEKEEYLTETEVTKIINYCLAGLEQCVLRFPEHYKSIYRLCHFYSTNKNFKDNSKCRDLLLGTYKCQYHLGYTMQGLFADRKSTNFFNGVWRIPNDEIDRPGSFASHMSRCVTLLMQVLKETDDSRMLMELCVQLRKTPDPDKKYVRDSEREQLSRQASTLCLQSLRTRVQSMGPPSATDSSTSQIYRTDARTHVLLDVYKIYQQVQKNIQGKEVQAFATLLVDTYKSYMGIKSSDGNILEAAMRYCHQQNIASKTAASQQSQQQQQQQQQHIQQQQPRTETPVTSLPVTTTAVPTNPTPPVPTSPHAPQQRKPYKSSGTGRPRGRPPNVNKHLQAMQNNLMMNQMNAKGGFGGNYMNNTGNQALMNPFFMSPLMDQNMLSAMLTAGLGNNMMDSLSAMNYLTYMGGNTPNYGDLLRQYQNNSVGNLGSYGNLPLSSSSSSTIPSTSTINTTSSSTMPQTGMAGLGSIGNLGSYTVQQLLNMQQSSTASTASTSMYNQSKPTTTLSSSKDLSHAVSITPVNSHTKQKSSKHSHADPMSSQLAKTLQSSQPQKSALSPSQVSLLKPSVIQPPKSTPPKQMSAPQIRVSKSLTEPQPAHNSSLSVSPMKSGSPSGLNLPSASLQNSGLNIKPVPMGMQRGTSLQHKLLSKKQNQSIPQQQKSQSNVLKKQRQSSKTQMTQQMPTNLQSLLGMGGTASFIPSELSGISVSPVSQNKNIPPKPGFRKASKSKAIDMPSSIQNPIPPATNETFSMLSQLQQHSHLEIIPQGKSHSKGIDFPKNLPLSLSVVPPKQMEANVRPTAADSVAVYEMPRKTNSSSKKADKSMKDSVEIITLDD